MNEWMKRRRIFVSAIAAAAAAFSFLFAAEFSAAEPAVDLHGLGVVYLHGKGGWPGGLNGGILGALKEEGALVATPEMPWSFHRRYDATFDQALTEIEAAIARLKSGSKSLTRSAAKRKREPASLRAIKSASPHLAMVPPNCSY